MPREQNDLLFSEGKTLLEKSGTPEEVLFCCLFVFLQIKFFQINLGATCIKDDLELLTRCFLIFHKKGGALKLFMLE